MTPLHRDKEARTTTVIYRPLSLPLDKKYLHGVCISIRSGTYQIMSLLATIRAQTNKGTRVTGLYHMPPQTRVTAANPIIYTSLTATGKSIDAHVIVDVVE